MRQSRRATASKKLGTACARNVHKTLHFLSKRCVDLALPFRLEAHPHCQPDAHDQSKGGEYGFHRGVSSIRRFSWLDRMMDFDALS
jgi:hypothetical protein